MFPFDVILFDVGGVLLTNGWDHRERARVLRAQFHLDLASFEARHAASNDAWERDLIALRNISMRPSFTSRAASRTKSFSPRCSRSRSCLPDGAIGNPGGTCGI